MGIFGALSTSVTGLRAQAFALENISGNIANSQTTGFKRIDTDFRDLIPDAPQKLQVAGSVLAQSRSTNNVQGDVRTSSTETFMAINGSGFFVVEPPIGQADGGAIFSGANYYTRRGDFSLDKNGFLVNGAGYYLKGLPIDPSTSNVSGSVPQVLQVSNQFLPAAQTTRINYQLNLPQFPKTVAYQQSQAPGTELLNPVAFNVPADTAATTSGADADGADATSTIAADTETLSISIGSVTRNYVFTATGGSAGETIDITDAATDTVAELLAYIQNDLVTAGATGAQVGLVDDAITVTAGNTTDSVVIANNTTDVGLANGTYAPTASSSARVDEVAAQDADEFIKQSISGGAITVYAENGAPANVQIRWAKIDSTDNGGQETWNMYVLTDGDATGGATAWSRVGGDYIFGANGSPDPVVEFTEIPNLEINGVSIGDVRLQHGVSGLTQFSDPNGAAQVTTMNQNGYAAGQFVSVGINDSGRIIVSYSNGQQLEVAQIVTANFNAVNQLKRMDGGVFAATSDSGEPILTSGSSILGSALEASNTDISEEFTRLIVTQQAYAAGTRIVSTANEMLQQALNMIR